ncbi:GNAT family N-acetyltransferase [Mycobacterium sp.]|uniref:GNAT family N-acetyltransferase n=1 Tax=Mycobacterium sp. TaxID=1785 RepID=UPI002DB50490|nr:GNAT family N-acetyltransferase [Mycobacterium sp.]
MDLRTERLWLTPLDPSRDAQGLHPAFSDPEVMRWWNTPMRADMADTRRDLAQSLQHPDAHMWVVRESQQPVGLVGLLGGVDVPGLSWLLRRDAWGFGYMTEAAAAVVEYAFGTLGLARVEAWVESSNIRSLSVARRIGLTERGRLAQRYPHRNTPHESIVLGRSRQQEPASALDVEATLAVPDLAAVLELLRSVLGARTGYVVGDPPTVAGVVLGPWSVGPRLRLAATPQVTPVTVTVDVGTEFDAAYARAVAVRADIAAPPVEQPWGMREFVIRLPGGHHMVLTGPA